VSWLQDLPADYLKFVVQRLLALIEAQCKRLAEKREVQVESEVLGRNCNLVCNYLSLLYQSNKSRQRVASSEFNSAFLASFFEPVEAFRIYLSKSGSFNFVNFPFLLGFDYKYKLMQIESIYEQKLSIRKNMENGLSAIFQNIDFNHGIEGLIFLYISVNRHNLLDDSMEKLGKIKQNLKSPLKIEFIGEEGADEGGVKNEYFSLVTKAIFNPYLDMFLPKNLGRYYWFNGFSYEIPLRFEFVGMLLGLSLYNSVHLDLHFPDIIYKKLLLRNYEEDYGIEIVEDLKEIEPDVYRTLKDILTTSEDVAEIELYFNIELESFGEKIVEELVEDGHQIKVTNDNREYYCLLYADYILNKHIAKQFAPFRRGFYRVVSGGIIEVTNPLCRPSSLKNSGSSPAALRRST
jgi:ubiquitin-protein ligase E3 A